MSHNCAECDRDRSRSALTPGGVGCGRIFSTAGALVVITV